MKYILKPIKKVRLQEDIIRQIHSLIFQKKIAPGTKLPPERDLANMLNVNRISLREALRILEALRIIEIKPGDGIYVNDVENYASIEWLIMQKLIYQSYSKETFLQILELRRCVDLYVAQLAATRATEEDINDLWAAVKSMKTFLQNGLVGESGDDKFHLAVARASHNGILVQLTNTIHLMTGDIREEVLSNKEVLNTSINQHIDIVKAIEKHNPDMALKAMERHVTRAEKILLKHI